MGTAIYTKPLRKLEKTSPSNASPEDITPVSMAWQVQGNYGQIKRVPLPLGRQPHTRAHSSPWGPQLTEEYQVLATQGEGCARGSPEGNAPDPSQKWCSYLEMAAARSRGAALSPSWQLLRALPVLSAPRQKRTLLAPGSA